MEPHLVGPGTRVCLRLTEGWREAFIVGTVGDIRLAFPDGREEALAGRTIAPGGVQRIPRDALHRGQYILAQLPKFPGVWQSGVLLATTPNGSGEVEVALGSYGNAFWWARNGGAATATGIKLRTSDRQDAHLHVNKAYRRRVPLSSLRYGLSWAHLRGSRASDLALDPECLVAQKDQFAPFALRKSQRRLAAIVPGCYHPETGHLSGQALIGAAARRFDRDRDGALNEKELAAFLEAAGAKKGRVTLRQSTDAIRRDDGDAPRDAVRLTDAWRVLNLVASARRERPMHAYARLVQSSVLRVLGAEERPKWDPRKSKTAFCGNSYVAMAVAVESTRHAGPSAGSRALEKAGKSMAAAVCGADVRGVADKVEAFVDKAGPVIARGGEEAKTLLVQLQSTAVAAWGARGDALDIAASVTRDVLARQGDAELLAAALGGELAGLAARAGNLGSPVPVTSVQSLVEAVCEAGPVDASAAAEAISTVTSAVGAALGSDALAGVRDTAAALTAAVGDGSAAEAVRGMAAAATSAMDALPASPPSVEALAAALGGAQEQAHALHAAAAAAGGEAQEALTALRRAGADPAAAWEALVAHGTTLAEAAPGAMGHVVAAAAAAGVEGQGQLLEAAAKSSAFARRAAADPNVVGALTAAMGGAEAASSRLVAAVGAAFADASEEVGEVLGEEAVEALRSAAAGMDGAAAAAAEALAEGGADAVESLSLAGEEGEKAAIEFAETVSACAATGGGALAAAASKASVNALHAMAEGGVAAAAAAHAALTMGPVPTAAASLRALVALVESALPQGAVPAACEALREAAASGIALEAEYAEQLASALASAAASDLAASLAGAVRVALAVGSSLGDALGAAAAGLVDKVEGAPSLEEACTAAASIAGAAAAAASDVSVPGVASEAIAAAAKAGSALANAVADAIEGGLTEAGLDISGAAAAKAAASARARLGDAVRAATEAAEAAAAQMAEVEWEDVGRAAAATTSAAAGRAMEAASAQVAPILEAATGDERVQEILGRSRQAGEEAMLAAIGVATSVFDLLLADIMRDGYQILGLVMSSVASDAMENAKAVWGNFAGIISLDFSFVAPSISPIFIYVAIGALGLLMVDALLWLTWTASRIRPDLGRDGPAGNNWVRVADESPKTVRAIYWTLQTALFLYLPVSRVAIQVMACDASLSGTLANIGLSCSVNKETGAKECDCAGWAEYPIFAAIAGLLFVVFTLGVPAFTLVMIRRNRPRGVRGHEGKVFDEDGYLVEYRDEMYHEDVTKDVNQVKCPYQFLYRGYERRWAYYKVFVMVFKLLLALPVVLLATTPSAQGAASMLLLAVFAFASLYTAPFVNPVADSMEASTRVSSFFTVLFGFVSLRGIAEEAAGTMGALINVVQSINFVVLASLLLFSVPCFRLRVRGWVGALEMTDSVRNMTGRWKTVLRHVNPYRECKHRIWHAFWNSVVVSADAGTDKEGAAARRLVDLQQSTSQWGLHRIKQHWTAIMAAGNEAAASSPEAAATMRRANEVMRARQEIVQELVGDDVFWDDPDTEDGHLDSKTRFGRCHAIFYPFLCVVAYEDSDDVTWVEGERVIELWRRNLHDPGVVGRRNLRMQFRALDGARVRMPYTTIRTLQVPHPRGGGEETIDIEITFEYGILRVTQDWSSPRVADRHFRVSLAYEDGHGEGRMSDGTPVSVDPSTRIQALMAARTLTVGHEELGINEDFAPSPLVAQLLNDPHNRAALEERWQPYQRGLRKERGQAVAAYQEEEKTLSSGFWYFVYNDFEAPRERVEQYLSSREAQRGLKELTTTMSSALDHLYERLDFARQSVVHMYWFSVWDSVWEANSELLVFKAAKEQLDPQNRSSIAWKPMRTRDEIDRFFTSAPALRRLRQSRKFVSNAFVDALVACMQSMDEYVELGHTGTDQAVADITVSLEGATMNTQTK